MSLIIEPLGKRHDRGAFSCGAAELDAYLKRLAGQDVRRRIAGSSSAPRRDPRSSSASTP